MAPVLWAAEKGRLVRRYLSLSLHPGRDVAGQPLFEGASDRRCAQAFSTSILLTLLRDWKPV